MSPKTEKPMALGIGSDVLYVLDGGPCKGQNRPAKVVQTFGPEVVNLQVFIDGANDGYHGPAGLVWQTSIKHDSEKAPGTWHWPEEE